MLWTFLNVKLELDTYSKILNIRIFTISKAFDQIDTKYPENI